MANDQSIILHQFARSPYSEKIRLALRLKNLSWVSVDIPPILPKPDLMPLTGGYRRTPVLQIGADVYCDTSDHAGRAGEAVRESFADAIGARGPREDGSRLDQRASGFRRVSASFLGRSGSRCRRPSSTIGLRCRAALSTSMR